jgi:hypothetical protein
VEDVVFTCDITTDDGTQLNVPETLISRPFPNKRYLVAVTDKVGLGWFCCLPEGTKEVICTYHWEIKVLELVVKHEVRLNLNYTAGNRLFSTEHKDNAIFFGDSFISPISFGDLPTISGCARDVEDIKQLPRFRHQIERYERSKQNIEVIETCNLMSCAFGNFIPSLGNGAC